MKINNRTLVISAFIQENNKYLIVFDPKFKFWRTPGGRLEEGESEEETIKREIKEELDIDIEVLNFIGQGKDDIKIYNIPNRTNSSRLIKYYKCKIKFGEPKIIEKFEIAEIKWVTKEEMKQIRNIEPAIKEVLDLI